MLNPNYIPQSTRQQSGQAVVRLDGRDLYLGKSGSVEAKAKYEELLSQWLANGRSFPETKRTIGELVLIYLDHSKTYYAKSPKEIERILLTLKPLTRLFRHTFADEFGPLKLKAVHDQMLKEQERISRRTISTRQEVQIIQKKTSYILSRRTINQRLGVIKRMFKWAAENELPPVTNYQSLTTVPGLKQGRSPAKESTPIKPVCQQHIDCVRQYVILLCSGETPTETLGGHLLNGADDFIQKPMSLIELRSRVRGLLKRRTDKQKAK